MIRAALQSIGLLAGPQNCVEEEEPPKERSWSDYEVRASLYWGIYRRIDLVYDRVDKKLASIKRQCKILLNAENRVDEAFNELEILKSLDSKFTAKLKYAFQTEGTIEIILGGIEGYNLREYLELIENNHSELSDYQIQFYMVQLCLGIEYLHSKNIAHRYIALECLHLSYEGHLKIADFGKAKANMGPRTRTNTICVPYRYYAHEQLTKWRQGYTRSVDYWGLGIVLIELYRNKNPFDCKNSDVSRHIITRESGIQLDGVMLPGYALMLVRKLVCRETNRFNARQIREHGFFPAGLFDDIENGRLETPTPKQFQKINSKRKLHYPDPEFYVFKLKEGEEDPFKNFSYQPQMIGVTSSVDSTPNSPTSDSANAVSQARGIPQSIVPVAIPPTLRAEIAHPPAASAPISIPSVLNYMNGEYSVFSSPIVEEIEPTALLPRFATATAVPNVNNQAPTPIQNNANNLPGAFSIFEVPIEEIHRDMFVDEASVALDALNFDYTSIYYPPSERH